VKSYFGAGDCVPLLPILQRIALLLLLGFLAGVAVWSFEAEPEPL
jgi:hypothetical protein